MSGLSLPTAPTLTPALKLFQIELDPSVELRRPAGLHLPFALGLKTRFGLRQRLASLIARPQPGRRFITAIIAMALVFVTVGLLGLSQQLFDDRDIGAPPVG